MTPPMEMSRLENRNKQFDNLVETFGEEIYAKLFSQKDGILDKNMIGYSAAELLEFAIEEWGSFASKYTEQYAGSQCLEDIENGCELKTDMLKDNSEVIVAKTVKGLITEAREIVDEATNTPYYYLKR